MSLSTLRQPAVTAASLAVAAALTVSPRPLWGQTSAACSEPNVLVLLDISGSMGRHSSTPPSKYDQAVAAIDRLVRRSEAAIRYALAVFPAPGAGPVYCSHTAAMAVGFALYNYRAIHTYLAPTYDDGSANPGFCGGPRGDYDTPMFQALQHAGALPSLLSPTRRNYVLLITDGSQDCCRGGDYDDEPDCNPEVGYGQPGYWQQAEYEENLTDLHLLVAHMNDIDAISTFVVGFGAGVDARVLDTLARSGGTARPGCATGDCYYHASSGNELTAALEEIARIVQEEICDGLDNDCDGYVDEGTNRGCQTACGSGFEYCYAGAYQPCSAGLPESEVCDQIDNDCDGVIDEGCHCLDGETVACGTDVGLCTMGVQECVGGRWQRCEGGIHPGVEACDGRLDEDCDGHVDEGCRCVDGDTQRCGTATGICQTGVQHCNNGRWGSCQGAVEPQETDPCDGLDNNCNGQVDESCACLPGETRACGSSHGTCEVGYQPCEDGAWGPCLEAVGPVDERCDGLDNDCDGETDNAATCPAGAACRCGRCAEGCPGHGTCPGNAECVGGHCVRPQCREGTYCDGYLCVPGAPPRATEDAYVAPESTELGGPEGGCLVLGEGLGALHGLAGLLLLPTALAWRRTTQRRRRQEP